MINTNLGSGENLREYRINTIKKNKLCVSLTLLLLVSTILMGASEPLRASPLTIVSFDPIEIQVPNVGENFTINVNLTDIEDLGAWEFKLDYNTTILNVTYVSASSDTANNTDWLPDPGAGWVPDGPPTIDETNGIVWVGALVPTTAPGTGLYGNITLVTINATAAAVGNSTLHLYDVVLGDWIGDPVDHTVEDGEAIVLPPPLPVISLNPSEYTAPAPGESLTINVNVTDVKNLQHYEFKLWFNTTLLNATGVTPSPVNPPGTSFIPGKTVGDPPVYEWTPLQNVSDGFVWAGASLPAGQAFTGSETLMTISFTALTAGNCTLHLNDTVLVDSMEVEIDHLTLNGFVTVMPKIGEFHTHHINDATDDFPNDYMPMIIPLNGRSVVIAPVITCTALEDDVFIPYHYPCKLAQTLFADDDWSDKDANYTYVFEDWTDYDWNDIVVRLYTETEDIIETEIHLESREAAWKNPFGIEITPVDMVVEVQVYWNSTDYPEEHTLKLNPGETADIELFAESNPCDNAFITIIPLIPPVASFVYSPPYPQVCENVTFNASSSTPNGGYIVSYEWDFGDSSPHEFGMVVTHHYTALGTYNVALNVTDNMGVWDTETKMITVTSRTYALNITATTGGTTAPIPGSYSYDEGTIVSVTASSEVNYVFDHWKLDGDNAGSIIPISVTMDRDHTLQAVFKEAPTSPQPVGGHAAPIDKSPVLDLKIRLTPEISLVSISILMAAMGVTIILIRRRNKTLNREH